MASTSPVQEMNPVPARIYNTFCRLVGDRFSPYRSRWHQAIRLAQEEYFAALEEMEGQGDPVLGGTEGQHESALGGMEGQVDALALEFIIEFVIPGALADTREDVREELKEVSGMFLRWIAEDHELDDRYRRDWVSLADDVLWRSAGAGWGKKAERSRELLTQFRIYLETSLELEDDALRDLDSFDQAGSLDQGTSQGASSHRFLGVQPSTVILPSRLSTVMTVQDRKT